MRRLVILALLLLPVLPAFAEEEAGTTCDLQALVDPDDAGLLVAYDGLRKGLEIARLPRVCRHDPAPETDGIVGFLERRAMAVAPLRENGQRIDPFFVFGDESCTAVQKAGTNLPCVMAVTRYTAKRQPLVPLPRPRNGTLVYSDVPIEQIGTLVRDMFGGLDSDFGPRFIGVARELGAGERKRIEEAVGWKLAPPSEWGYEPTGAEPNGKLFVLMRTLLYASLFGAQPSVNFEDALRFSRAHKRPLISDNRAHFGLGAVVVIVPRHDLLGKAAADEGRKLRAGMKPRAEPRVIPGFEIWVDLAAADAIGLELPLSFLARADKLRRPRRAASGTPR